LRCPLGRRLSSARALHPGEALAASGPAPPVICGGGSRPPGAFAGRHRRPAPPGTPSAARRDRSPEPPRALWPDRSRAKRVGVVPRTRAGVSGGWPQPLPGSKLVGVCGHAASGTPRSCRPTCRSRPHPSRRYRRPTRCLRPIRFRPTSRTRSRRRSSDRSRDGRGRAAHGRAACHVQV
jgi:hypothetical protein